MATDLLSEVKVNIRTLKGRRKVAQFLNDLTIKNQTRKVKSVLNSYILEFRQKIVHLKVKGKPLLLEATLVGNLKLVNYLLDECGAKVEQTGYWETVKCTPLWVAASRKFVHVVSSLVEHGANVNAQSCSQRSVVSIGTDSLKVVHYLVQHGADIHIPDCKGRTCLMYAVHSARLCDLLITSGANVNQADIKGKDALHFAIRKGKIESVKVLIKNGADILRIGPRGNTPLELGAIECKPDLVEYLLGTNCYSNETKANAYELLGSRFSSPDDMLQANFYWGKALLIRNQEPDNLFPKSVPGHRDHSSEPIPIGVEFQTIDDLNHISTSHESIWTQSLIIQLRILGPKHPRTIYSFTEKMFTHINRAEFGPGMLILQCLFLCYATYVDPLPIDLYLAVSILRTMVMALIEIDNHDILHVYNFACQIIRYVTNVGMNFVESLCPAERENKLQDVELYMSDILTMLGYILQFTIADEQHHRLNVTLYNLIRRQPQGLGRVSLLQLAIRLALSKEVVCKLLECGADIDEQDQWGNTALQYAIRRYCDDEEKNPEILKCLLDHECHVDITNTFGDYPLEFLRQNGFLRNPPSLRCLAARVIRIYQIPYTEFLPRDENHFVSLH